MVHHHFFFVVTTSNINIAMIVVVVVIIVAVQFLFKHILFCQFLFQFSIFLANSTYDREKNHNFTSAHSQQRHRRENCPVSLFYLVLFFFFSFLLFQFLFVLLFSYVFFVFVGLFCNFPVSLLFFIFESSEIKC